MNVDWPLDLTTFIPWGNSSQKAMIWRKIDGKTRRLTATWLCWALFQVFKTTFILISNQILAIMFHVSAKTLFSAKTDSASALQYFKFTLV